ncbi:MAG: hydratase [Microbacterium sp.]|uniref:2-keto-4-pentenoate hydratase n=1 Tax=Microbacterium sp. TaxID=51671 RepID=UPI003241C753
MRTPRRLAAEIDGAHREGRLLSTGDFSELGDASAARETARQLDRLRDPDGTRRAGWKLGYTSEAMRRQMAVDAPNAAPLYRGWAMASGDGAEDLIHPRVEPEVIVSFDEDLGAQQVDGDAEEVVRLLGDRVSRAHCALEVVDSVWRDYRFTWGENTADGSSAARFVIGDPLPPASEWNALTVTTSSSDDSPALTGVPSDVMGHPLLAVAWLLRDLESSGEVLRAGEWVLTGGITASVPLSRGARVSARFAGAEWEGFATVHRGTRTSPQ